MRTVLLTTMSPSFSNDFSHSYDFFILVNFFVLLSSYMFGRRDFTILSMHDDSSKRWKRVDTICV